MGKKEISWVELVTTLSKERKSRGKPGGIKDVMDEAKKEWVDIKNGKHAKYIKGKPPKRTRKSKKGKKQKTQKKRGNCNSASEIISKCNMCKNCIKELKKHMCD